MTLEDVLKFPKVTEEALAASEAPSTKPTRPTLSGLNWLAVPSACVGLAYRASGSRLELVSIENDKDPSVLLSTSLQTTIPVIALTCSHDARLLAVCLADGSLRCYSCTSTSIQLRWTMQGAHSHVLSEPSKINTETPSKSRDHGAGAAGPVRALSFCGTTAYALALVDCGQQGLSIYHADSLSVPVESVRNQLEHLSVSSASWRPPTSEQRNSAVSTIALGTTDGTIHIYSYDNASSSLALLSKLNHPSGAGATCTHLDWINDHMLVAGYCHVTPAEDEDEDDEDDSDADDEAEHEPELFILHLDATGTTLKKGVDAAQSFGDAVPFFAVPKFGRHVFFTASNPPSTSAGERATFLFVTSNVASDAVVIGQESGGSWQMIDIAEGSNITTPTDDDDMFTYPTGLAVVATSGAQADAPVLLLSNTAGSLSVFTFVNEDDDQFFWKLPPSGGRTQLPMTQVEETARAISSEPEPPELVAEVAPGDLETSASEAPQPDEQEETPPATFGFTSGSAPAAPFGASTFSFGSGQTPAFGSAATTAPTTTTPVEPGKTEAEAKTGFSFGSGKSAPVFGSSGPSSFGGFSFGKTNAPTGSTADSPFNIFASKTSPSSISSMAKPLFGAPTTTISKVKDSKEEAPTAPAKSPSPVDPVQPTYTPVSEGGKRAARVFDDVDQKKTGQLPVSCMEQLIDQLGEGFHGDALQDQLLRVDPEQSGNLERDKFVRWYEQLIEGDGGEGVDEDEEDRREEAQNATEAFAEIAQGQGYVEEADFQKVIEELGTTYCEEDHARYAKKLSKSGKIYSKDFVSWYVSWLFDEEDESIAEEPKDSSPPMASSAILSKGWGDTFKADEGSWKCSTCQVQNKASASECPCCNTPKPGRDPRSSKATEVKISAQPPGTGISSSGFTFGAPATQSSIAPGGFVFGAPTSASGSALGQDTPISSGEKSGEVKDVTSDDSEAAKTAARAFDSRDREKLGRLPVSFMDDLLDDLGEGFHGAEQDKQVSLIDEGGTGFFERSRFIQWYVSLSEGGGDDNSTDDDEERKEEEENARSKFLALSKGSDVIVSSAFGDLLESMGTTYCPESHEKIQKRLEKSGVISLNDFVDWYLSWIFEEDDDSDTEASVVDEGNIAQQTVGKTSTSSGWGDIFKNTEGTWKCAVCSINNIPKSATKCPSCETPRPGIDPKASSGQSNTKSLGGIGPQGFTFSAASASSTGTSIFGGTVSSTEPVQGGFKFGITPKSPSEAVAPVQPAGQAKVDAPKPSTGNSTGGAYPPLDSKAPKPFTFSSDSKPKQPESPPKPTGSGYPPLDSKAPKPFSFSSDSKQKQSNTPSKSAGGGYPPLDSKAPKPFSFPGNSSATSGTKSPTKAYPPMDSKASKPFSFGVDNNDKPVERPKATAYPPMDSKAPTPFSFGAPSPTPASKASSAKPAASTYPPMDSKAPTPFSFGSSNATTSVTKTQATTSPASAYPPMDSKAPTPFSFGGSGATPAPAKAPAPKAAASAYPPMDSKAPKPFSFGEGSSAQSASKAPPAKPTASAYPPMDSKAPTPFSFGGTPADPKLPAGKPAVSAYPPMDSKAPKPFSFSSSTGNSIPKAPSKSEGLSVKSQSTPVSVSGGVPSISSRKPDAPPSRASATPPKQQASPSHSANVSDCAKQFASLTRKFNETIRLLSTCGQEKGETIATSSVEDHVRELRNTFVSLSDVENDLSESNRGVASVLRKRTEASRLLSECQRLLDHMRYERVDQDVSRLQPLDCQSEERRRLLLSMAMKADRYLRLTKDKATVLNNIEKPDGDRVLLRSLVKTCREVNGFRDETALMKERLKIACDKSTRKAIPKVQSSELQMRKRSSIHDRWSNVDAALPSLHLPAPKTFNIEADFGDRLKSPVDAGKQRRVPHSPTQKISTSIFFSPPRELKHRAEWDKISVVDQSRVRQASFKPPQELKQMTFLEASREALAPLGTTPEKLQNQLDIQRQPSAPPRPPQATARSPAPAKKDPIRAAAPTAAAESATTMALPEKVTPQVPKKTDSGMSAQTTPLFGGSSFGNKDEAKKSIGGHEASPKLALSGMLDLGSALSAASSLMESKTEGTQSSPDFAKILTDFYQKHKPEKVSEVPKTLGKYKGREYEMFEKLAKKYQTANPLSSNATQGSLSASSAGMKAPGAFGNASSSPFTTAPMGTTPGPAPAASSFGAPAPSPFAASTNPSPSPFGAQPGSSSSPFGSTSATTGSSVPFGSSNAMAPSPAPFAAMTTSASSPSPFGSPQPTQTPAMGSTGAPFGGRNPRDMLQSFYQQHKPEKIGDVDKLLMKYKGNEEQLFRNLAKKYQLNPSMFGLSETTGFGAASGMSPAGGFGQPSPLGGGPTFGGGFGQASSLGNSGAFGGGASPAAPSFGSPASGPTGGFGGMSGSTFGSPASASFGSLAQSTGFGGGGGFGSPSTAAPAPFGTATPFGAPRR